MFIGKAIRKLNQNIGKTFDYKEGNIVGSYEMLKEPTFTLEKLETKVKELEAEHKALQYQRDRSREYKKLNQFEMQFDDLVNGTTTWLDAIDAIKAKYPKPE